MARKFIYTLKREDLVGYDEVREVVVIAENVKQARGLAADKAGDEGRTTWLKKAVVNKIGYAAKGQKVGVVLEDYREVTYENRIRTKKISAQIARPDC